LIQASSGKRHFSKSRSTRNTLGYTQRIHVVARQHAANYILLE